MKKINLIIFLFLISISVSGCSFDNVFTENASSNKLTLYKNNNFSYQPMKEDTLNYIRSKYYNPNTQTKIVLYYGGEGCSNVKHFQKTMKKYKNSEKWNQGYSFVNFNVPKSGCLETNDEKILKEKKMISCFSDDYKGFELLIRDCSTFCIINPEEGLIYKGTNISDEYVYNVLYDFYNK